MDTAEYILPLAPANRQGEPEALLIVNSEGRIRSANQAAELLLGREPGQLADVALADLWSARPPERNGSAGARHQSIQWVQRAGDLVPVRVTVTPLAGHAPGDTLVALAREDDRANLNELLLHVQRLAGIGTLTASVTHELTSPLSIIAAALSNMREEMAGGELTADQLGHYLALMDQSVARAAHIVDVLRHYTHNDGELRLAVTSAGDIVRDALVLVEQQFRKRAHVEVETIIEGNLGAIVADHNRLTQVLINLLLNARDAMQPAGGTIQVRFWPLAPTAPDSATAAANGSAAGRDYFAFSVSDAGPGIAPETLDHLFEPFFTTKPSGQGTGLGLFISQGIISQHGGRIWAENNLDGGATFITVLPRRPK